MTKITNPSFVRKITKERGFTTKKRFGQNFLVDNNIINRIIESAELGPEEWVMEIGPGLGALTSVMAEEVEKVVALEIDRDLVAILADLISNPKVAVVEGDALLLNWREVLQAEGWVNQPVKLIANLPYYLTSPLIMKALEGEVRFSTLVVMVQREVADRILAEPGTKDYGVLTLAVQYYTDARLVMNVPRTVFLPAPNVDSAVVQLTPREATIDVAPAELFAVIRAAFQQRRKTVRNALKSLLTEWDLTMEELEAALIRANLEPTDRGERLSLADFKRLTQELTKGV